MNAAIKLLLLIVELLLGLKKDYDAREQKKRINEIRKNPGAAWNRRFNHSVQQQSDKVQSDTTTTTSGDRSKSNIES